MFSNSGMQEKLESFEGRKHYLSSKIKRKHTKKKYHLWGVVGVYVQQFDLLVSLFHYFMSPAVLLGFIYRYKHVTLYHNWLMNVILLLCRLCIVCVCVILSDRMNTYQSLLTRNVSIQNTRLWTLSPSNAQDRGFRGKQNKKQQNMWDIVGWFIFMC